VLAMGDTLHLTIRYSPLEDGWVMAQVEEVPGALRNTRSRAKHKPAAARIHRARYWLDRRCPACRARPGEPCRTPTGAETNPHAARLKNSDTEYHAYLEQTNAPDLTRSAREG